MGSVQGTLGLDDAVIVAKVKLFEFFESRDDFIKGFTDWQRDIVPRMRLYSVLERVNTLQSGVGSFHQTRL